MHIIETLINNFSRLPGLGPRSSRRLVLYLLENRETFLPSLVQNLSEASDSVAFCSNCGNVDASSPCHICQDEKRDSSRICIIENIADLWAIERSNAYKGLYHVLGGVLSPGNNVGPADLRIPLLLSRIQKLQCREIILATNSTLDGQTTGWLIAQKLDSFPDIKVTRLAHGIPIGGELDYMDEGTISTALKMRHHLPVAADEDSSSGDEQI